MHLTEIPELTSQSSDLPSPNHQETPLNVDSSQKDEPRKVLFKLNFNFGDKQTAIVIQEGDDFVQKAYQFALENQLGTEAAKKVYELIK